MSLRYIFGESGTGKTSLCTDEIASESNTHKRLFYIVPEQFTLESEKNLLNKKGSFVNINVLGFNHLAYFVISSLGTGGRVMLDSAGRAMLIKKIILEMRGKLEFYGSAADRQGFADSISDTVTELMQYSVSCDSLEEIAEEEKNSTLGQKLKDISLIYRRYMEYMAEEYLAGDGALDYLPRIISNSAVKDSEVWIDGFKSFTPQENRIISELMKHCRRVSIVFDTGCDSIIYNSLSPADREYEVKKAVNTITMLARENNVAIEKPVLCKEVKKSYAPAIRYLRDNYFRQSAKPFNGEDKSVKIYKFTDMYSEIDRVCSEICALVSQKGYRYRDIAVITGSNDYDIPLSLAFRKFGIPDFLDARRDISSHPLISFILSAVDIVAFGWDNSAVFRFLKTGYTPLDSEAIFELENYTVSNGINRYKWHKEWKYGFKKDENDTLRPCREDIIASRDKLFEILSPLKDNFTPSKKAEIIYITEKLFDVVTGCGVKEKLEKSICSAEEKGERTKAVYYKGVWDEVLSVLDKIAEILGGEKVSLREYSKILSAGLSASTVGIAPTTQDHITAGDIERTRLHDIKAMFVIGANEGNIPPKLDEKGVLTESEKEVLEERDIELSPTSVFKTNKGLMGIYANLIKPTELLVVSYPLSSLRNDSLMPSSVAERINELFPDALYKLSDENDAMLFGDYGFDMLIRLISKGDGSELLHRLFSFYSANEKYAGRLEAIKKGLLSNIRGEYLNSSLLPKLWENVVNTLSISKLENFAGCPFRFYMSYVLKAKEREVYGLRSTDAGLIAHKLLEMFSSGLKRENMSWDNADREYADEFVDSHIAEVAGEFSADIYDTNRNSAVLEKLAQAVKLSLWASMEQIKSGRFRPEYFEIGFGDGRRLPAIEIELDGDKILKINGVIDRVDKMLSADGKIYVRVVDYKSSAKAPDINSIYGGLQLQLVMYMNALCNSDNVNPAGMFYFEVNEPSPEEGDNGAMDTEEYILSRMAMRGIYDEKLENELSPSITGGKKITLRDILQKKSIKVSLEELKMLMDYAIIKAKSTGAEMARGNIAAAPVSYNGSACTYCPYMSVCGFDCRPDSVPREIDKDKEANFEKIHDIVEENKYE